MVNEQLLAYIRQQLAIGVPKDEIRKSTLAVGWDPVGVNEALTAVEASQALIHTPTSTYTSPITPIPVSVPKTSSKSPLIPILIGAVGLLVIGGGVAYAYFQEIGPFSVKQYTETSFVTDILAKSSQITTSSYAISASLTVDPRDKNAEPFIVPAPDPTLDQKYKDDSMKMSAMSSLLNALNYTYGSQNVYDFKTNQYMITKTAKIYPANLPANIVTAAHIPGYTATYKYAPTDGGRNFALSATFETSDAISTIRNAYGYAATTTPIDGQKVTFTKDSQIYVYLSPSAPQPFLATLANLFRSISPDVSATVAIGATADFSTNDLPGWHFTATADGNLGDLTYQVDVEALRKDSNYYIRINKMPALFGDLASYKGQWIMITPTETSSTATEYNTEFSYLASNIPTIETQYKQHRADVITALRNLALLADTDKLISFKEPPIRENVDGRSLYRYDLEINKNAIIPFYKDLLANSDKFKSLGIAQDQGLLDYLQSTDFNNIFTYIQSNTYLTLWTDKDGFPAILQYRIRVVPPDTATQLTGKQIDVVFKLTLSSINQPVNIVAPQGAIPIQTIINQINNNTDSKAVSSVPPITNNTSDSATNKTPVTASPSAPTASITSNLTILPNTPFTISGTGSPANGKLFIAISGIPNTSGDTIGPATIQPNGTWSLYFNITLPAGSYPVAVRSFVPGAPASGIKLLTRGTLNVTTSAGQNP